MHFPHLRVASAYSAHYGVARPHELAQVAASYGAQVLACTDRDGLYGVVKHVLACQEHGVAPVLGVDLALLGPVAASAGKHTRAAAGRQGQHGRHGRSTVPPARVIGRVCVSHRLDATNPPSNSKPSRWQSRSTTPPTT